MSDYCGWRHFTNGYMIMMTNAQSLLKSYAADRSEDAFRELVARYIGLVHSTALRQLDGDVQLAEDISQVVFSDLARDAGKISGGVMLGGWLHQRTVNAARTVMRSERRRQAREKEAAQMGLTEDHTALNLARIGPALDEAITRLSPGDRAAVVLRFFERQDLREVGKALGVNEDAAQKRVSRALEKIRLLLGRNGVVISASALGALLAAEEVAAATAQLVLTITAAALSATAVTPSTVTLAAKTIGMTTIQKLAVGAALVAALGTAIYESRQAALARADRQALQQAQAPMVAGVGRLQRELADATNRLAVMAGTLAQTDRRNLELLALRGEVTRLRRQSQELAAQRRENGRAGLGDAAWLDRVGRLKQRLEQTPEAQISELKFLTDEDWLGAASGTLDTDADYHAAFGRLRATGEGKFLRVAEDALRRYLEAHHDRFPSELSQLAPYFEAPPPGQEILQRYQIVASSEVPELGGSAESAGWLITLKSPDSGALWALGKNGVAGSSAEDALEMKVLAPAISALFQATPMINGKKSVKLDDLGPYLSTPEQTAAYQRMMQRRGSTPQ